MTLNTKAVPDSADCRTRTVNSVSYKELNLYLGMPTASNYRWLDGNIWSRAKIWTQFEGNLSVLSTLPFCVILLIHFFLLKKHLFRTVRNKLKIISYILYFIFILFIPKIGMVFTTNHYGVYCCALFSSIINVSNMPVFCQMAIDAVNSLLPIKNSKFEKKEPISSSKLYKYI